MEVKSIQEESRVFISTRTESVVNNKNMQLELELINPIPVLKTNMKKLNLIQFQIEEIKEYNINKELEITKTNQIRPTCVTISIARAAANTTALFIFTSQDISDFISLYNKNIIKMFSNNRILQDYNFPILESHL